MLLRAPKVCVSQRHALAPNANRAHILLDAIVDLSVNFYVLAHLVTVLCGDVLGSLALSNLDLIIALICLLCMHGSVASDEVLEISEDWGRHLREESEHCPPERLEGISGCARSRGGKDGRLKGRCRPTYGAALGVFLHLGLLHYIKN